MADGKESIDAASQSANALADILKNVDSQIGNLIGNLAKTGQSAKTAFAEATDSVGAFSTALDVMPSALENWDSQMGKTGGDITRFVNSALEEFTKFGRFFLGRNMFEAFGKDAKTQFETVSEGVTGVTDVLKKLGVPDSVTSLINSLAQTAEGGQKAEAGFYGMLAASGQLDTAFDKQTNVLKNLDAITANYNARLADVADATNMSVKQVIQFANDLGKIPGIMDGTVVAGGELGDSMDATTAALKLMSATGQQATDVIAEFSKAQQDLGNITGKVNDSSQKAANFISAMAEISKDANLTFNDARSYLEGVAEQFKFVGDNTDAASRVMHGFSQALQDTGLTAKASADIVADMVKQVTQLNLGTKAFISLRSGGPGGLQGAFRYEELIRQGRLDEVVNMMQRAFRQQAGGRIYSLDEAASSPQAAAQFARQRSLLQSGVFGIGRGANDEQANRILEALKSGNVNVLKDEIKTGQAAIKETTERGAQVQERNNQILNQMARNVERTAIAGELTAAAEVKQAFGTNVNSKLVDTISKQMQDAQEHARSAVGAEAVPRTGEEERSALDVHADAFKQAGKDLLTGTKIMAGDILNSAKQPIRGAVRPPPPPPLPVPTIPMDPGPRPETKALTAAAAAERGTEHATRVRQIRDVSEDIKRQQQQKEQQKDQNVKLQIEVTAPQGYGVNVASNSTTATVITKSMNPVAPDPTVR